MVGLLNGYLGSQAGAGNGLLLAQALPKQSGGFDADLEAVYRKYPALKGHSWAVVDSRKGGKSRGRHIEFYPPDERDNPRPGQPTLEIFNPDLQGESLQRALFGDMLHYQPMVDPKFAAMRDKFGASITPEQLAVDRHAWERARAEGDPRSFEDWFNISRLDAYIRGYLAPDEADEWRKSGTYSPEQAAMLDAMLQYLQTPR